MSRRAKGGSSSSGAKAGVFVFDPGSNVLDRIRATRHGSQERLAPILGPVQMKDTRIGSGSGRVMDELHVQPSSLLLYNCSPS